MRSLQSSRVYIALDIDDDQLATVQKILAALVVIAGAVLVVSQAVAAVALFVSDVKDALGLLMADLVGLWPRWEPVVGTG